MVSLCSCGGLIWKNKVHVCGTTRCSCGGIQFNGRGHCCGYKPDYSKPPTDYELWRGFRISDEWMGSPNWGKRSPTLFNTRNQETSILNTASAMEEIKNLKQTGSFHEYCVLFDILLTKVILSENYATNFFVDGLKPEIKWWVKFLSPKTLEEAYEKAKNQVCFLDILEGNKEIKKVVSESRSTHPSMEISVTKEVVSKEVLGGFENKLQEMTQSFSDIKIQFEEYESEVKIQETVNQDSCDSNVPKENEHEMGHIGQGIKFKNLIGMDIQEPTDESKNGPVDHVSIDVYENGNNIQETINDEVLEIYKESMVDVNDSLDEKNDDACKSKMENRKKANEMLENVKDERNKDLGNQWLCQVKFWTSGVVMVGRHYQSSYEYKMLSAWKSIIDCCGVIYSHSWEKETRGGLCFDQISVKVEPQQKVFSGEHSKKPWLAKLRHCDHQDTFIGKEAMTALFLASDGLCNHINASVPRSHCYFDATRYAFREQTTHIGMSLPNQIDTFEWKPGWWWETSWSLSSYTPI